MTSLEALQIHQEYYCQRDLNLYKSPDCDSLVTQAASGRHLRFQTGSPQGSAISVQLCEDDYSGWVAIADLPRLALAPTPYQAPVLTADEIQARLPAVIHFAKSAMTSPNSYLWGGTLGPDYDCSGLVQAAFASEGIRLPRDSYQQEAFVTPLPMSELQPGDLLFFGSRDRTTHVALYLGDGNYIHSSGKDQGRNGIGIDSITRLADPVSQRYHAQLRGGGRITHSYQPKP